MVYSTSRCPKCGKVIKRQTNPTHEIGNPFERCRWCGNIYLNSYKEEWITKSPIKRFFFFIQSGVWARALLLPILVIIIPMGTLNISPRLTIPIWMFLAGIWLVAGYIIHKNASEENIKESIDRTNDPEYIELLKKAGYKIYPIKDYKSYCNTSPENTPITPACPNPSMQKELLNLLFDEDESPETKKKK